MFSCVGEENKGKKVLIFFCYVKGGRATLRPLARMAAEYTVLNISTTKQNNNT